MRNQTIHTIHKNHKPYIPPKKTVNKVLEVRHVSYEWYVWFFRYINIYKYFFKKYVYIKKLYILYIKDSKIRFNDDIEKTQPFIKLYITIHTIHGKKQVFIVDLSFLFINQVKNTHKNNLPHTPDILANCNVSAGNSCICNGFGIDFFQFGEGKMDPGTRDTLPDENKMDPVSVFTLPGESKKRILEVGTQKIQPIRLTFDSQGAKIKYSVNFIEIESTSDNGYYVNYLFFQRSFIIQLFRVLFAFCSVYITETKNIYNQTLNKYPIIYQISAFIYYFMYKLIYVMHYVSFYIFLCGGK